MFCLYLQVSIFKVPTGALIIIGESAERRQHPPGKYEKPRKFFFFITFSFKEIIKITVGS